MLLSPADDGEDVGVAVGAEGNGVDPEADDCGDSFSQSIVGDALSCWVRAFKAARAMA